MNLLDNLIDKIIDVSSIEGRVNLLGKVTDKDNIKKIFLVGFIISTIFINIFVECIDTFTGIFVGAKFNVFMVFIPRIFSYFPVYLIVYVLFFIIYYKSMLKIKIAYSTLEDGQKGTARFSTREEIDLQYKSIPKKDIQFPGYGGIPIARNVEKDEIYIDDGVVNTLIIGSTRSGKGETSVFPSIDNYSRAEKQVDIIANDTKAELYANSKEELENRNYDTYALNLADPDNSMSYNPLQLVIDEYKAKNYDDAQLLCNSLTFTLYHNPNSKDPIWENSSMSLVNAIILALCEEYIPIDKEEKITMYTVANMILSLGSNSYQDEDGNWINELDEYFKKLPSNSPARLQYATIEFSKGNTRSSIYVTTMAELRIFTFDKVARLTSKNTLDMNMIGEKKSKYDKPKAVFLITPFFDKSNHKIASIYLTQLNFVLGRKALLGDGKCPRRVAINLDEVGNMPIIPNLSNAITVGLGIGIIYNLWIQSYSQLEEVYGKQNTTTIRSNCGNQIYILTTNEDTAESFSKQLGNKTQVNKSRSGDILSTNKTYTESTDSRRLLTAEELMSLKEGETVVFRNTKRRDKNMNKIRPRPIFNEGKYAMQYRYEYLSDTFDNSKGLSSVKIDSQHINVNLNDLLYESPKEIELNKYREKELESYQEKEVEIKITQMQKFKIIKVCDNLPSWHLEKIKELDNFNDIKKYLNDIGENNLYNEVSKMQHLDIEHTEI